jgi:hypothetical protein
MLISCSKSFIVNNDNYDVVKDHLNKESLSKPCYISYGDIDNTKVFALSLGADSAKFVTGRFQKRSCPVSEVNRITLVEHSQGAKDGALALFVVGSGIGMLRLAGEDGSAPFIGYLLLAAIYGLPSSALGAIFGYIKGSREEYIFIEKIHTEVKPAEIPK